MIVDSISTPSIFLNLSFYINKNDFVISLKEINESTQNEISFGTGEFEELYKVDYVYTENYIETKYYLENSRLPLVNLAGIENWTVNGEIVNDSKQDTKRWLKDVHFENYNLDMKEVSSILKEHLIVAIQKHSKKQ